MTDEARAIVNDFDVLTSPAAFNLTDLGNAERLVARHGADLRYCPQRGWLVWDGCRWRDDDAAEVVQGAGETMRALYAEAGGTADDDSREALAKHALASEREPRIRAAVALAATDPVLIVRTDDLDADPDLFNCANGTLHLPTGALLPHDREHLLTKLCPVEYDPDATAPTWEACLAYWTLQRPDLADFLRSATGYTLAGRPREQLVIFLYGLGSNGKTTCIETIGELFGEYGQQTPAQTFLEKREGIPSDVARLRGARFVSAVEMPEGRRLNETLVKRLTGGDTITARFLHREWFQFRPLFVPWIAANNKPEIRGTDLAIWRRIRLVPFEATIAPEDRDPDLADKLRAELPGILRWAVGGYAAYRQAGKLEAPVEVAEATAAYRAEQDSVGDFLAERCLIRADLRAKPTDLFRAFEEHFGREVPMGSKAFYAELQRRGFESRRNGRGRWYAGLSLLTDDPTLLDEAANEGGDR